MVAIVTVGLEPIVGMLTSLADEAGDPAPTGPRAAAPSGSRRRRRRRHGRGESKSAAEERHGIGRRHDRRIGPRDGNESLALANTLAVLGVTTGSVAV